MADAGTRIDLLSADGAGGLRAGVRAAGWAAPHLDHCHALCDLGRIVWALEHAADQQLAHAERVRRAAAVEAHRQVHGRGPHPGRPVKEATDPQGVAQATAASDEAIQRGDGAAMIQAAVREALRPRGPAGAAAPDRGGAAGGFGRGGLPSARIGRTGG